MALNILRLLKPAEIALKHCLRVVIASDGSNFLNVVNVHNSQPNLTSVRCTNFFNKLPAEHIWKGVTSVSSAGAKKGRGKGASRKKIKNLNKGQTIGVGKSNIVWPGLTTSVLQGNELVKQRQLPEDPEREAKLIKLRDSVVGFRFLKLEPLERGWSGTKMPGRELGPPDPVGDYVFEGFKTKCLEFKPLLTMRGHLGRVRTMSAVAVTGNGEGLAGFALGKSLDGQAALRKARNRAAQKLINFNLYNGHTVYHDFFSQFGRTKIFASQKPPGYGLRCHRAIKTMCEVIGIKDLHAKVEGSTNLQHIVKAFFIGLLRQKTHKQIAEEKQLNLVEFRKENEYFPKIVGKPSETRTKTETNEVLDFKQYVLDNKVVLKKKKYPPFYTKLRHWPIYLKKLEKRRNHEKIRFDIMVEHGKMKSFLTDKFPEIHTSAENST